MQSDYYDLSGSESFGGSQNSTQQAMTVSQAMGYIKSSLENMQRFVIMGEVSSLSDKPSYKALYFVLTDGNAVMNCTMWRNVFNASGCPFKVGDKVEVTGNFTSYAKRGDLQFNVRTISPAGEGILRIQVDALAKRLAKEGLFAQERKRPLPPLPTKIGVVTSPNGKAIQDILRTLRRRYPQAEVYVAGVTVEGKTAPAQLILGLKTAAEANVDVIILGRGGGSYEDLMPFNDESLARAIAACPIPIVTGIGHEPDNSIADMAADVRASTPTGAAEAVSPDFAGHVNDLATRFNARARVFESRVNQTSARLDASAHRLGVSLDRWIAQASHKLELFRAKSCFKDPLALTSDKARDLDYAMAKISNIAPRIAEAPKAKLASQIAALDALSPHAVLARGYGYATDAQTGTVIDSVNKATIGSSMLLQLKDGVVQSTIECVKQDIPE